MKGWEAFIQKLRKEYIENNIVEKAGTTVQVLTTEEEEILQNAQVKMKSSQYKTKIRWLLIYNKKSKNVDEGNVKKSMNAYLQELSTSMQSLKDSGETNTAQKYGGGKFGLADGIIGDWLNRIYWTAGEKTYRMRRLYNSVINQSLYIGENPDNFYLDPASLAALIHFPQQKTVLGINPVYANQMGNYQEENQNPDKSVIIQQYQPAFYIHNPDGTQIPINPVQPVNFVNPMTGQSLANSVIQSIPGQLEYNNQKRLDELKNKPPEDLPT
jgi:hypothetical protein